MRYGVCVGNDTKKVKLAAEVGYDYVESGFQFFGRGDDAEIENFIKVLDECNIKCEAANCFMPSDLPVSGPDVDDEKNAAFVEVGMRKGKEAGLKTVVFGSSGARRVPEGFGYDKAFRQLGHFLADIVSPIAEKYGITVTVEPLSPGESDIINTVYEGVMLSAMVNKDNIKGLADLYHMVNAGDTADDVKRLKGSICHGHISNPVSRNGQKRLYPLDDDEYDYKSFVEALEFAGCERCSIEAGCIDFDAEAPVAIKMLKSL